MRSKILIGLWFLLILSMQVKADLRSYLDPGDDGKTYSVSRSALTEKTKFLLHLSEIPQKLAARFGTNEAKVLYFELDSHEKSLYLIEAPEGRWASSFMAPKNIYAKFDVTKVDEGYVYFDMLSGLRSLSIEDYYSASDGAPPSVSTFEERIACRQNMLGRAVIEDNDVLAFDHTTTCEVGGHSRAVYPLALRYFLRLYYPSPDFVPKKASRHKEVGYFETPAFVQAQTGREITYAHRWNIAGGKKITFAISSNTPKELRPAIRQAILYWNNYLPEKPIKVIQLKKPEPVPSAKYNVVQWDDYSEAHSAYANFRVDPLTGEIKGADVYLPSAFAIGSKERLRKAFRLLSTLTMGQEAVEGAAAKSKKSCNHTHKGLCSFALPQDLATAAPHILDSKVEDKALAVLGQEYIASTVAHEIGHVLGLRHNFAGNLGNEVTPMDQTKMFYAHLKNYDEDTEEILDRKFSSSVMHYCSFEVDILLGYQILRNKNLNLSYDAKAIKWGYHSESFVEGERPNEVPFVSDYRASDYLDVGTYKVFKNPVLDALTKQREFLLKLPHLLIEQYIAVKAPLNADDRLSLREVGLTPRLFAWQTAKHTKNILDWCYRSNRVLSLDSKVGVVTSQNEEALAREKISWFKDQVKEAGGLSEVLFSTLMAANSSLFEANEKEEVSDKVSNKRARLFDPDESLSEEEEEEPVLVGLPDSWPALLKKAFVTLLYKDHLRTFIGADGEKHEFTEAELKLIEEEGKRFFDVFFEHLTEYMLGIFSEAKFELEGQLAETPFFDKTVEKNLGILAKQVIFAKSKQVVKGKLVLGELQQNIIVPAIGMNQDLRLLAARMISADRVANKGWCAKERQKILVGLKDELAMVFGFDYSYVRGLQQSNLTPELWNWFYQQLELIYELSSCS